LINVFIFEDGSGGSMSPLTYYQTNLISCDAVLFLIKRKEDLTPAVLDEVDLAREQKKKCLFLFNKTIDLDKDFDAVFVEEVKDIIKKKYEKNNNDDFRYLTNKINPLIQFITDKYNKVYNRASYRNFSNKALEMVLGDIVNYYRMTPEVKTINGVRNIMAGDNIEISGERFLND
jgi:predicted GTPase